ncbi:MAG: alpha/beta fold hydrolase [Deltaproteobacteria bacterium]|nr:alpha/beta fold hydrolase [Deltaproteobacteria bacterium]
MREPDEFRPPWPLSISHVQTLGAAMPLHLAPPAGAREESLRFPIPGGALHASAWLHADRRPAVVLVHGVGGSIDSRYVVRAAAEVHAAGYHAVRLNLRGAGSSLEDAPLLYHGGLVDDLRVAATALRARADVDGVHLIGFSLGGNCVLRFAAEPDAELVRSAIGISAPLDLAATSRLINRARVFPYRAYVLAGLLRQGLAFAKLRPERVRYTPKQLLRVRTIWAYDDVVVAPMHGFGDAANYYAQVSAGPRLPHARIPALVVHADDDPMVPGHTVQPFLGARASTVDVAWSRQGGHVGWFRSLDAPAWKRTWALERALEFLARLPANQGVGRTAAPS